MKTFLTSTIVAPVVFATMAFGPVAVLAENETSTGTETKAIVKEPKIDVVCMQNAVEKRDTAIITAFDTSSASLHAALSARKDALKAAWGKATKAERKVALKAAWSAYNAAAKKAKKDLRTARTAAWDQFRVDRKACGPTAKSEDSTPSGVDAQL